MLRVTTSELSASCEQSERQEGHARANWSWEDNHLNDTQQPRAGDGLQRPLCSRFQPHLVERSAGKRRAL